MINKAVALALLAPLSLALAPAQPQVDRLLASTARAAPVDALLPVQARARRFVVAATGNEARYRVQEKIVGVDVPNYEAIGKTEGVTGALVFDRQGRLVPAQSKITIDVTKLKSDQDRRDGYVQRRLLETEKYPTVVLAPTAIRGIAGALPTSGTRTFQLIGDLTVRGVTKPTTWNVTAQFQRGRVTGTAVTEFTFADFEMQKPSVPVVLSLADQLKLEYTFNLTQSAS
ncbi:MAG: YceI family protein [Gemmatimonadetes bacterium]|nr:YceI family protein [Gemmatimonadota bacterium]